MSKVDEVFKLLKATYPRAISHAQARHHTVPKASMRENHFGGSTFKTLVKKGIAKQITVGYYVWTGKDLAA